MKPLQIVITGGGPSATFFLARALMAVQSGLLKAESITILDPRVPSWGGTPHSTRSTSLRVNMRLNLHNFPGNHIGFEAFLAQIGATAFDPPLRADLGLYTRHVAENTIAQLRSLGCNVRQVPFAATAVHPIGNAPGYVVRDADGGTWPGTHVILATGHQSPSLPAAFATVDPAKVSYYDGGTSFATRISPNDRVLVIGTGPGAIDVARCLVEEHGVETTVNLRSRQGLLSAVQTPDPVPEVLVQEVATILAGLERSRIAPTLELLATSLAPLMRRVDARWELAHFIGHATSVDPLAQLSEDIAAAEQGGPAYRQVVEAIGSHASRIWRWLGPVQQERFMKERDGIFQRLYYVKRHAQLAGTAIWLRDRMVEGRVTVGSTTTSLPEFDRLVVATGPEYRVARTTNPLIRQMLASALARPSRTPSGHELGGLWTRDFQLATAPGIFAMGSLARGEDFAVHGYPSLDKHAKAIVAQLR